MEVALCFIAAIAILAIAFTIVTISCEKELRRMEEQKRNEDNDKRPKGVL